MIEDRYFAGAFAAGYLGRYWPFVAATPPSPTPEDEPRLGAYLGSADAFAFQGPRRPSPAEEAEEILALLALLATRR